MSNRSRFKKHVVLTVVLFLFPLSLVLFFAFSTHHFQTLPYYDLSGKADSTARYAIAPFALRNQDDVLFSSDSLRGKVWIASFYSLSDPLIADITNQMLVPNWRYRAQPDILIVTFSTAGDAPADMAEYVRKNTEYNAFPGKWQFLTGTPAEIDSLAQALFGMQNVRSTSTLKLIDDKGHIRGSYNGNLGEDVQKLVEDVGYLKKEIDEKHFREKKQLE
ncbi:MAG: SCO family protein, partial [Flavobacteriales bacterium]|nr:SCO family protein [Flavobacteriales bacterium]